MCTIPSLHKYGDYGLLALRIGVAAVFLYHGTQKWAMLVAPPFNPALFKLLAVVEPLGGAAVLLGILTQYAAAGLGVIMLGAIYLKSQIWGTGFAVEKATGWEFDLMVLAACVHLFLVGAGKMSVDANWKKG